MATINKNNMNKNNKRTNRTNTAKNNGVKNTKTTVKTNKSTTKSTVTPILKNSNSNNNKSWSPKPENMGNYTHNGTNGNLAYNINSNNNVNSRNKSKTSSTNKTAMKKSFMSALEDEHDMIYNPISFMQRNNLEFTENGAVSHSTSGSDLLDIHFSISSLRGADSKVINEKFRKAFAENPYYAVRWLFYARDIRGGEKVKDNFGNTNDGTGLGERTLFRTILVDMAKNGMSEYVKEIIPYVAEIGRYDDLWPLLDVKTNSVNKAVLKYVKQKLAEDISNYHNNKSISLLAKWLPSGNASSKTTKKYANIIRQYLGWSWPEYQQTLSALRAYLDIVERKMSSNNWQAIDYEHVSSRANLIYNDAFLRHDEERRRLYLNALTKGEAKINASTLFPHDIVHKYGRYPKHDEALEQLWKNLPDYGIHDTLVVADGSGSMLSTIGDTKVSALSVANALAIYCSEHNKGEFKNKYITFSNRPKFVKFEDNWTLRQKIAKAYNYNEIADTNIEAVFNLILNTAINNNLSNDEMIKNILIISDMQFNSAVAGGAGKVNKALFDVIEERFNAHGYTMPKLIFWNVMNNRWAGNSTFPVTINQGFPCTLVSGFSVSILQMVMNGEINPYNALIKTLSHPHYDFAEDTLKRIYTGNEEF